VIGGYYYSHRQLNNLFWECGAPGDPPVGNCCEKVRQWLLRTDDDPTTDGFSLLGKILEDYMERDDPSGVSLDSQQKGRQRIKDAFARYGLSYHQGGRILGANVGPPAHSLEDILRKGNFVEINVEFDRAIANIETNPRDSITAACTILESLCKVYIEDEGLEPPSKQTVKPLWGVVQRHLHLDPSSLQDKDLTQILSGLTSIVDGIGSLRTHTGSAHGRGRKSYKPSPRHARLAVNAAHTLTTFLLETWTARKTEVS
jgi:hypothetical protein